MNIIKTGDTWWPTCDYDDPLDRISHYAYQPGCPLLGVNRTRPLKDLIKVEKEIGWQPFARKILTALNILMRNCLGLYKFMHLERLVVLKIVFILDLKQHQKKKKIELKTFIFMMI